MVKDLGVVHFDDIDLEVARRSEETYRCVDAYVDSVCGETEWTMGFRRGDWEVRTVTRTVLTSSATDFHLHAELDAFEGDHRVLSRNWQRTIPRDHV